MPLILLADDNELNRDMLSRRLQRAGYETVMAVDGVEAVNKANEMIPDLIIMDMNMPVMDGWDATREIKQHEDTQNIPVLGMSAHAMSSHRQMALAAGCFDYDTKPVDFQRLLNKLKEIL